jgi:hypothetical protein
LTYEIPRNRGNGKPLNGIIDKVITKLHWARNLWALLIYPLRLLPQSTI